MEIENLCHSYYQSHYILLLQNSVTLVREVDSFGEERDVKPNLEQLRLLNLHLQTGTNGESTAEGGEPAPVQIINVQSMSNPNDGRYSGETIIDISLCGRLYDFE